MFGVLPVMVPVQYLDIQGQVTPMGCCQAPAEVVVPGRFVFEDVPATDRCPDEVYLSEVERCDVFVGLLGQSYGMEDVDGLSPTEREFDRATALGKHRMIFLTVAKESHRHIKMQALVAKAQTGLIRKRFNTAQELVSGLYAALVDYLEDRALIRSGPFDATACPKASQADLDVEIMTRFIRNARRARQFPLTEHALSADLLKHLNLLDDDRPTNAAVLLFGKAPQRFLISSEVKCAHFHGTEVSKPIPSYQVYKGTAFGLVDQAVDFVLSKVALSVGTRVDTARAPVTYEIPKEVVNEAIVNAVAHRDYTSHGSIQVMLFADRLEVRNPGRLPPTLTPDMLRVAHGSVPHNPLLAESLYLAEYIERMGTGTLDIIRRCAEAGLQEPSFAVEDGFVTTVWRPDVSEFRKFTPYVTPDVTPDVARMLLVLQGEMSRREIQEKLGLTDEKHFREHYQQPAIAQGLLEMTIPLKPRSKQQKYRLTDKGHSVLAATTRLDRSKH